MRATGSLAYKAAFLPSRTGRAGPGSAPWRDRLRRQGGAARCRPRALRDLGRAGSPAHFLRELGCPRQPGRSAGAGQPARHPGHAPAARAKATPGRQLAQALFDLHVPGCRPASARMGRGRPVRRQARQGAGAELPRPRRGARPSARRVATCTVLRRAAAQRLYRGRRTADRGAVSPPRALSLGQDSLARGAGRQRCCSRAASPSPRPRRATDAMAAISHGWNLSRVDRSGGAALKFGCCNPELAPDADWSCRLR